MSDFLKKHLQELLLIGAGSTLCIIGGQYGYTQHVTKRDAIAADEMTQAIAHQEAGHWRKALEGDGIYLGYEQIVSQYPGTKAANRAYLRAGICAQKLGKTQDVLRYLEKFYTTDKIEKSTQWQVIGHAYMDAQDYRQAASYYKKAACCGPNSILSPQHWLLAVEAYTANGDLQEAIACCEQVIRAYPHSPLLASIKKERAYCMARQALPSDKLPTDTLAELSLL